jgi:SHS2 domain-containing protein
MSRYEEIPHTADWSFHVVGATLNELFQNAAYAMFEMEGIRPDVFSNEIVRVVNIAGIDYESLFINWLSELIYLQEANQEGYYYFLVEILPKFNLRGQVRGQPLDDSVVKLIKGVTYHKLEIKETKHGWETTVVVDV